MEIFKDLFAKIEAVRDEELTAGTRFRLMGVLADIVEVTQALQTQVLEPAHTRQSRCKHHFALVQPQISTNSSSSATPVAPSGSTSPCVKAATAGS